MFLAATWSDSKTPLSGPQPCCKLPIQTRVHGTDRGYSSTIRETLWRTSETAFQNGAYDALRKRKIVKIFNNTVFSRLLALTTWRQRNSSLSVVTTLPTLVSRFTAAGRGKFMLYSASSPRRLNSSQRVFSNGGLPGPDEIEFVSSEAINQVVC